MGHVPQVSPASPSLPFFIHSIPLPPLTPLSSDVFPIAHTSYPSSTPLSSGYTSSRTLTQTQWVSVLRLSTMWFFKDIRERAIAELSKAVSTPTARIVLARTYNIPGWTEPALRALAQQEQPLSAQDLEALGWDTAAKLFQIRESVVFSGSCVCGCNYCSVAHGQIANVAAGQGPHGHGHGHPLPPGGRSGQVTLSTVRKQTDFSQQIRAVFGTALY